MGPSSDAKKMLLSVFLGGILFFSAAAFIVKDCTAVFFQVFLVVAYWAPIGVAVLAVAILLHASVFLLVFLLWHYPMRKLIGKRMVLQIALSILYFAAYALLLFKPHPGWDCGP